MRSSSGPTGRCEKINGGNTTRPRPSVTDMVADAHGCSLSMTDGTGPRGEEIMRDIGRSAQHALRYFLGLDQAETQTTAAERQCLARYASGRRRIVEIG